MSHVFYVTAAYAVTGVGVLGLILVSIYRRRKIIKALDKLEQSIAE
jgi:heme exporter protein CcmD